MLLEEFLYKDFKTFLLNIKIWSHIGGEAFCELYITVNEWSIAILARDGVNGLSYTQESPQAQVCRDDAGLATGKAFVRNPWAAARVDLGVSEEGFGSNWTGLTLSCMIFSSKHHLQY